MSDLSVRRVVTEETLIEISEVKSKKDINNLIVEVRKLAPGDNYLERVFDSCPQIFMGIGNRHLLRLATPRELGIDHEVHFRTHLEDLARRHGLGYCQPASILRVAIGLAQIKPVIPEAYSAIGSFAVHMATIDFKYTGELRIPGLELPRPVFNVWSIGQLQYPLFLDWVYPGHWGGVSPDQPVLFCKME